MTLEKFAKQLSSYIDYSTILQAIEVLQTDETKAKQKMTLFLGSKVLTTEQDWDLYAMINDYLSEFRIPKESIELIAKSEQISPEDPSLKWLREYRFDGHLENPENLKFPQNLNSNPIIAIVAENCILDILYYPVNFLLNTIETLSRDWHRAKELNARVFLEPSSPSELFIYIEKRIANKYEFLEKQNAGQYAGNNVFIGYRYICMTTEIPVNFELLKVTKQSANYQAMSTL